MKLHFMDILLRKMCWICSVIVCFCVKIENEKFDQNLTDGLSEVCTDLFCTYHCCKEPFQREFLTFFKQANNVESNLLKISQFLFFVAQNFKQFILNIIKYLRKIQYICQVKPLTVVLVAAK